jgi:hypothetical protein
MSCINPICKAANRVGHTIDNCFWPGGGKEGQWPEWWFIEVSLLIHLLPLQMQALFLLEATMCSKWHDELDAQKLCKVALFFILFSFFLYFLCTDYSIEGEC